MSPSKIHRMFGIYKNRIILILCVLIFSINTFSQNKEINKYSLSLSTNYSFINFIDINESLSYLKSTSNNYNINNFKNPFFFNLEFNWNFNHSTKLAFGINLLKKSAFTENILSSEKLEIYNILLYGYYLGFEKRILKLKDIYFYFYLDIGFYNSIFKIDDVKLKSNTIGYNEKINILWNWKLIKNTKIKFGFGYNIINFNDYTGVADSDGDGIEEDVTLYMHPVNPESTYRILNYLSNRQVEVSPISKFYRKAIINYSGFCLSIGIIILL